MSNSLVSAFPNTRILVIGDLMLDETHFCKVDRISPEAPVPICSVQSTTHVPGGAANVANNIASLGGCVMLMGLIGEDSSGTRLLDKLSQANIDTQYIVRHAAKPTILKSRIVAHQQHVVRVDREDTSPIHAQAEAQLITQFESVITTLDAIIISDYLKGTLTPSLTQTIIKLARQHQKPVIVDPKGNNYEKYQHATVLTPNFGEFKAVAKTELSNESAIQNAGIALIQQLQLDALLITRSEKGMSLILPDGSKQDISTTAKEVFDITGAGDTVIALMALCLAQNQPFLKAASVANLGAGIVVGKAGTATLKPDELANIL